MCIRNLTIGVCLLKFYAKHLENLPTASNKVEQIGSERLLYGHAPTSPFIKVLLGQAEQSLILLGAI
jgi:hypothetical protein